MISPIGLVFVDLELLIIHRLQYRYTSRTIHEADLDGIHGSWPSLTHLDIS